jgi:hypothetical protein
MTMEEQGLYRNLLDEISLREDGIIPAKSLGKASGDPVAWERCGANVLKWMVEMDGGWTNLTALEQKAKTDKLSESQSLKAKARWEAERAKKAPDDAGAYAGAYAGDDAGRMPEAMPNRCLPYPYPYPYPDPYQKQNPKTETDLRLSPPSPPSRTKKGTVSDEIRAEAEVYRKAFNAVMGRKARTLSNPALLAFARERQSWELWEIAVTPLLAKSAGKFDQEISTYLRNGSNGRTGPDGKVTGGYYWIEQMHQSIDRVRLDPRLSAIADHLGYRPQLTAAGVKFSEYHKAAGSILVDADGTEHQLGPQNAPARRIEPVAGILGAA